MTPHPNPLPPMPTITQAAHSLHPVLADTAQRLDRRGREAVAYYEDGPYLEAADCEPDPDPTPADRTPTPSDLRRHEMGDLRDQHAGPHALWTAQTVPTGSYL